MTRELVPPSLLCECGHVLKDHPIRSACRICPCTRYVTRDPFACLCGHIHRPGMACDRKPCMCMRHHTTRWLDVKW